jgi:hypothetical protein
LPGKNFNVYLPEDLAKWVDEEAKKAKRKRNNWLVMILNDLKSGRIIDDGRSVEVN